VFVQVFAECTGAES